MAVEALNCVGKHLLTHYEECESLMDDDAECDCGIEDVNTKIEGCNAAIEAALKGDEK